MLDFNVVYKENKGKLTKYVKARVYPHTEIAMEIVDDTFIKVNEHLKNFDENKANIRTWIFTIANNKLTDYYRSIKLDKKCKVNVSDYVNSDGDEYFQIDSNEKTDGIISHSEKFKNSISCANRVVDAMAELSDTYRNIAAMRFIDEMSYEEISVKLNLPLGTVKTNIFRAKELILKRAKLTKNDYIHEEVLKPIYY